jgi:hypothetical protein
MLQMSVEATRQAKPVKGYFAISDLLLVERNEEDVASFQEKERVRWLEVYDEVYGPKPQASCTPCPCTHLSGGVKRAC